nr:zinc finger protein 112 [Nothobranchius furzeri]
MDTDVQQIVQVKEDSEKQSAGVEQQDPEHLHIKEEKEELWTSLKGEHLCLKEETDSACSQFSVVSTKSEDDEEKRLFSQLHQQQVENKDVPTSSSSDQMTAEICGVSGTSRNPDLNPHEQTSDSSETEVSGDDDMNLDSGMSDSESETGDKDHDWNEKRSSESDVKTVNISFSCLECGERFHDKQSLQKHVRVTSHSAIRSSSFLVNKKSVRLKQPVDPNREVQKELKSFSCDCGKIFGRKSSFNRHQRIHTGQKPFACELCGNRFTQKSTLNTHMRVHTGQKPFICELCGNGFTEKSTLRSHMRIHTGQKPFICDLCGNGFTRKSNLNTHMIKHTGQKPFICELCGNRFTEKSTLNTHMRVHTGQKPFICELCGNRFTEKSTLHSHMRVHTGQKPFICDLCGNGFTRKSNLNSHMRVHTGQKPFICELCGDRFTEKSTLNTHMRVHTGQKPFICDLCGNRFTCKSNLNSHMRVHTGQKPFICELCEKSFKNKSNLSSHMRVHTGQKPFSVSSVKKDLPKSSSDQDRKTLNTLDNKASSVLSCPLDSVKEINATSSATTTTTKSSTTAAVNPAVGTSITLQKLFGSPAVLQAKVLWCLNTAVQHHSYASNEGVSELFQAMFSDSEMAKSFTCGKDKTSYVLKFGLAPHVKKELISAANNAGPFVLMFDESFNQSTKNKQLDVHIRFWEAGAVQSRYLGSQFVGHSKAKDLLHHFKTSGCVQQMVQVKEDPEEQSAGVDQQDPEHLHIKEEKEELWTSLKGEHLCLKEETDSAWFQFSAVSLKSEDDEENRLLSQIHQQQIEDKDVPTSGSADQMTAETGGGAGTSRNPDLNPHEQTSDSSETEVSGDDDMNPDSGMSDSGSETGDEDHDWNEKRSSESGVKTVNISFTCLECGERFHDKQSLQKHVRVTSHSAIRSPSSLVNKKSVRLKQSVDSFREVQKELKSFSCGDCGKIFRRKSTFNRHQRVHTGQKPFACELCGKRFTEKSTLNTHMRIHTGQKPFACELCGNRFTRKSNLNTHMRVHTGQKPFICELCEKSFKHKSNLNSHMRVHTGQKPFVCELCGKRFTEKSTLNDHVRVHTGHKPFVCELCEKRFTQKSHLNTHMRVHTGHNHLLVNSVEKDMDKRKKISGT